MTTQILRIDSSLFGEQGVSTQLNETLVKHLQAQWPEAQFVRRDLAHNPLPHFSAATMAAISTAPEMRDTEQTRLADLADQLIAEVQTADVLVVAAPMYNFGISSGLKAWLDYIARAGVTFRYSEKGPEGLLLNKTLYIVTSRGGVYKDQPNDTQVPYLRTFFNFLGITDVRVIYAEGINIGLKEQSLAQAEDAIKQAIQTTAAA